MLGHIEVVDDDNNIARVDINTLNYKERKRIEDLSKILDHIEADFDYRIVGPNHLVFARKNTSGQFHLRGLAAIYKWCVCYAVDTFDEKEVPISKLHYLPVILTQRALQAGSRKNDEQ